jgi:transcriptional regulator with XRE-family HTH domain
MNFYDTYLKLCTDAGKKPSTVALEIPISKSIVTRWKKGNGFPTDATLARIANYFGVTVESLKTNANEKTAAPEGDGHGVNPRYFDLSPEDRATVDALIERLSKGGQ